MSRITTDARDLAAEVLVRMWRDGAWAAPTLDAALRRAAQLDARDKRLATELVYGVLQTQAVLERAIGAHARNDRWRNKATVRAHLCIAAYQLLLLDRIPAHAAVSQAVNAIKSGADRKVAGFANAVLRKIARSGEHLRRDEAAVQALPAWLRSSLRAVLGEPAVAALVAGLEPPPSCLCLRRGEEREGWLSRLAEAAPHATVEPGALSPRCIALRGAGDVRALPGCEQAWVVQEEGAQVLALAVGARPGETVLDACAGRGNKALIFADDVGAEGAVDAADLHASKLHRLEAAPAGRRLRALHAVDWTRGSGTVSGSYDRVLVDAPCSGVGTLRRRPEIASRLGAGDVARMAALQLAITRQAASHVRDGGRLVYAVCSILPEECEEIADALPRTDGLRIEPAPFDSSIGAEHAGGASRFRLLPHEHGCDGYFAASFVVRRPT